MPENQNGKNNSIIVVSECWECPLSYTSNGHSWCSHPDGQVQSIRPRTIAPVCPLRKAPAIIMLKDQADELEGTLTKLGERLFGDITK